MDNREQTKQNKTYLRRIQNIFRFFGRSVKITWQASPGLFITRSIYELICIVLPFVSLYISKAIINIISAYPYADQKKDFFNLIIVTVSIALFNAISSRVMNYFKAAQGDLVSKKITLEIIQKINQLDISYFDNPKFYDEMKNALRDSGYLQGLAWAGISLIRNIAQVAISAWIMVGLNWYFPIMILLLVLPSVLIDKYVAKKKYQWQLNRARNDRKLEYVKSILQSKKTAQDIRLFGVQDYFKEKYIEMWGEWFDDKKKLNRQKVLLTILGGILPIIATVLVMAYVGEGIFSGAMTVGDYSLYSGTSSQLQGAVLSLNSIINQSYESEMRLSKYEDFLSYEPLVKNKGVRTIEKIERIEFKNVSFTYPQTKRAVLNNVSFSINPNQSLAIVGLNGAGKTTIVKLLLRLYDPNSGEILVNGVNLKEYDIQSYYKCIGVVFQDFYRYNLKIREAVALTDIHSVNNDELIIEACEKAGFDMSILNPGEGIDTYLGKVFDENGVELSIGNWQKIAIAQAFIRNASMMVFDEPNSALDPAAERKLFEKMASLSLNKCVIYVTHRLAAASTADQIIVINNGTCCESGSHKELMEREGLYKELFSKQAEYYQDK